MTYVFTDLNNTILTCNNDNTCTSFPNVICDKNSDIADYTDIRRDNTYILNDIDYINKEDITTNVININSESDTNHTGSK